MFAIGIAIAREITIIVVRVLAFTLIFRYTFATDLVTRMLLLFAEIEIEIGEYQIVLFYLVRVSARLEGFVVSANSTVVEKTHWLDL